MLGRTRDVAGCGRLRVRPGSPSDNDELVVEPFDDSDIRLPATFAHGLQSIASATVLQGVEQGGHQTCTSGPNWMTQCDGSAVDIDFCHVWAQFLFPS